jgi:TolB-like protein/DNA-binding SARP family transcriptional activator
MGRMPFDLDPISGELRRDGAVVKLAPQPLRVLGLLAARAGQVVSREEIRRELWGDGVHVDFEQGLNSCIKQVRQALGDPKLVETVPKRGYRLVRAPKPARRYWIWAAAAALLLIGLSLIRLPQHTEQRHLLAVLPFEDLTPATDSFSDGLTEETTTQLSRLQPERLGVIARASAMAYKKSHVAIPEIGRALGVDYVLQGSVRRDAGRLRISAQLIQVSDQTQLWAATYERESGSPLAVEAGIAGRIATSLAGELLPGVTLARIHAATTNSQSYEAYLRGERALGLRNDRGFTEAIDQFSRAVKEDPNYALAYVGLADTYSLMGEYYLLPPSTAFPKAREAALRALEIDDSLAEAQTSLAFVMAKYDWDWPGAEARFRRSMELNSGYATTHQWYAELLSAMGRHDEAIAEIARARQLDPLSLIIQSVDGYIYYNARRYDEAIARCRAVLDKNPRYAPALEFLMLAYERKGMEAETLALERAAVEQAIAGVRSVHFLAARDASRSDSSPYSVAARYAVLGQRDQAFRWLDRACDRHDALLTFAKVDPNLDALHQDPRFPGLLKRVGLSR